MINKKKNILTQVLLNAIEKIDNSTFDGIIYYKYDNPEEVLLGSEFFAGKYTLEDLANNNEIVYNILTDLSGNNIPDYSQSKNIEILQSNEVRGLNFNKKIIILDSFEYASKEDIKIFLIRVMENTELILIVDSYDNVNPYFKYLENKEQIKIIKTKKIGE